MGAMASQTTSLTIVHSTVYSGADPKGPVTRRMFPFDDVIMSNQALIRVGVKTKTK